jgi:hypothetical protein
MASVLAVLGMVALGLFYVGVTAVIVPAPWFYVFWLAWLVLLVLTIVLAIRRPTRALVVPLASAAFIATALAIGLATLGWGG